jgi:hypothetical protein
MIFNRNWVNVKKINDVVKTNTILSQKTQFIIFNLLLNSKRTESDNIRKKVKYKMIVPNSIKIISLEKSNISWNYLKYLFLFLKL